MSPSIRDKSNQNELDRNGYVLDAEKTLRLIASLPAPEGLEERVKAGLHAAPRQAKVIVWPFSATRGRWMQSAGMRATAAAAIVLVVAGGGWEVYSHIHLAPLPTAVAQPQPLTRGGGFQAAEGRRVPQTLEGPVVPPQVIGKEKKTGSAAVVQKHGKRSGAKKNVQTAPGAR